MGTYEFKLPDIGEGVVEGEVVAWHVKVGDEVKEDDPILDVMTDKATVSIPSPVDGQVTSISGEPGDIIAVGSTCIVFNTGGESPVPQEEETMENEEVISTAAKSETASQITHTTPGKRVLASPAVRKMARESGIELSTISGTGPAGRVTRNDLEAHMSGDKVIAKPIAAKVEDKEVSQIQERPTTKKTEIVPQGVKREGTTEIPVIGLRRKIADQMSKSKRNIPHFSYFEEVDVTNLEELRKHMNSSRIDGQPKLTYLPFIMKALVKSLEEHPGCNAHFNEEENKVVQYNAINLGIATATERGLYVPVVKNVESRDIWNSADEMIRVSGAARNNTASAGDLTGSSFTITSLGRMGGLGATPIINHPEVAILGVHKAEERAVVREGKIVVRRIMNLSSSFDHRVVDGYDGAAFIQTLKNYLEHPATIFM